MLLRLLIIALVSTSLLAPVSAQALEPVEVNVAFHLLDLNSIDTERETFSINGYLYLTWPVGARPEEWKPNVHPVNAQRIQIFYEDRTATEKQVTLKRAFSAELNSQFDFHRFPFDSSQLRIFLEPADERKLVRLVAKAEDMTIDPLFFHAQWKIQKLETHFVPAAEQEADSADRVEVTLPASRDPTFHIWSYLIPLFLITAIPWTVFWYHPPNPQVTVMSMLGLVGYNMAFARHLPELGYLSLADAYFLLCLLGICLSAVCCAGALRLDTLGQREKSDRFRYRCAWILPFGQFVASILVVLYWGDVT